MTAETCLAMVPVSNATYMERNTERRCQNSPKPNGYCWMHQRKAVTTTPEEQAAFAELKTKLLAQIGR